MSKKNFFVSYSKFIFKKVKLMRIFYWDFLENLSDLKQHLDTGCIIVGETDTVIGLFGICSQDAFKKLNEIKGRTNRPYIFLVSDIEKAKKIVDQSDHAVLFSLGSVIWPGPVTLIIKANEHYHYAAAENGTVAIRIPGDSKIRSFLAHFDALFSTSANRHKKETPRFIQDIDSAILQYIDTQIVFKEKQVTNKKPSTILRVNGHNVITIRGEIELEIAKKLKSNGFTID